MKLLTKFKLKHEGFFKAVNLDWREVAVELMTDLFDERKRRFACEQENYDLKQELAAYKYKENFDKKENNMFKAIRTIKKIKQLQKTMHDASVAFLLMQDIGLVPDSEKGRAKAKALHDVSHVLKDIMDGKSMDEAMKRLDIVVEAEEVEQDDDSSRD